MTRRVAGRLDHDARRANPGEALRLTTSFLWTRQGYGAARDETPAIRLDDPAFVYA